MFIYRLTEPIDTFDGLTPLNDWLDGKHPSRTAWALQAILALTDAAKEAGWEGDMRHLPMVGGLPTLGRTSLYMVIKQDNNGETFLVSTTKVTDDLSFAAQVIPRTIGAWTPDENDFEEASV